MRLSGTGVRLPSLWRSVSELSLIVFWAASSAACLPARGDKPVKEVRMEACQFDFQPARIELDRDSKLRLIITSLDVVHGFNIIGTDINLMVPAKGEGEAVVVFDPLEPGEYPFKCSKVCGGGHLLMRGVIVVR